MGSKLSWSHYRELLVVNDTEAIMYYIKTFKKIFSILRFLMNYNLIIADNKNLLVDYNILYFLAC